MRGMDFDLDQVLNPAAVFDHPRDVLNDPDLTKQEKRAILSAWVSDACAVQCLPGMRQLPDARAPVSFDEIIDALKSLDDDLPPQAHAGSPLSVAPWRSERRHEWDRCTSRSTRKERSFCATATRDGQRRHDHCFGGFNVVTGTPNRAPVKRETACARAVPEMAAARLFR